MTKAQFSWDRDCGNYVSPLDAAREALTAYAEQYAAEWPFDGLPPSNLVGSMVDDMFKAIREQ